MSIIIKENKKNKFPYYLRACRDCGDVFKSESKKGKYCKECKKERIRKRIVNSLTARGVHIQDKHLLKEETNESSKFDCKPISIK